MSHSDFDIVFSEMQVKQESTSTNSLSAEQSLQHLPCSVGQEVGVSSHDMQCLSASSSGPAAPAEKNSTYSLWAEYFDNFPIVTEFDLRSGATTAGSTGSSIASSSSAASESWSSPGSGSPFSDCEQEEPTFLDDHSVPNSVIDEIVQTLKMDGYNFDHLSEGIMENTNSFPVKQEHEGVNPPCFAQPVYACLNPPKLELHCDNARKYNANQTNVMHNNNNVAATNSIGNAHNPGGFDQTPDGKWLTNAGALPSMMTFTGISLQQVQQHTTQVHQQHLTHSGQTQQLQLAHPASHDLHQQTYASTPSVQGSPVVPPQYSTPLFPGSYTPLSTNNSNPINNNGNQQYKYMPASPVSLQPPPLTCEKTAETKPRRRRSTNSSLRAEKPHVCGECGAAFKLSANLKQHQVIHTGEKPFSCDICKAMFTRLSSLKTHHRLHTGEKPHICPYCSAAFADRSAMKAHKRIHTGERPYKCSVCQTSFTQLSHLNAHKRTHTGEKPYACVVCGTTFKQLGHLKRHEKSHVCSRM